MALGRLRAKSLERGFSTGRGVDKRVYKDFKSDEPGGSTTNPNDEGIEQPDRKRKDLYTRDLRTHIPDMQAIPYDEDREWADLKKLKKPKDL